MPWRHMGEWRYSSVILDFGTRWKWVVSFRSRPLYLGGNGPMKPLGRRLVGPQTRSGRRGEEDKSCYAGNQNPGRPALSPSLYRLSYSDSSAFMPDTMKHPILLIAIRFTSKLWLISSYCYNKSIVDRIIPSIIIGHIFMLHLLWIIYYYLIPENGVVEV
jgi:hypothetical protein